MVAMRLGKLENNNKYMYNINIKNDAEIKPMRHFFYALQWCFFAITLFFLYTKYIFKK
jgi:cytochrome oxidase assembly protein ShyY1